MEGGLRSFVLIPLFLIAGAATQTIVRCSISISALGVFIEGSLLVGICGPERSWTTLQGVTREVSFARRGCGPWIARGREAIVFFILETFLESCQCSEVLGLLSRLFRFGLSFGTFELGLPRRRSQFGGDIEVSHVVIETWLIGCAVNHLLNAAQGNSCCLGLTIETD